MSPEAHLKAHQLWDSLVGVLMFSEYAEDQYENRVLRVYAFQTMVAALVDIYDVVAELLWSVSGQNFAFPVRPFADMSLSSQKPKTQYCQMLAPILVSYKSYCPSVWRGGLAAPYNYPLDKPRQAGMLTTDALNSALGTQL